VNNLRGLVVTVVMFLAAGGVGAYAMTQDRHEEQLLPDLRLQNLDGLYIDTETEPGVKQLRFPTVTFNVGDGPFDFQARRLSADQWRVTQRILRSDGTWADRETEANVFFAGDGHDHWHVEAINRWEVLDDEGRVVLVGKKRGFCFEDNTETPRTGDGEGSPADPVYTARAGACAIGRPDVLRVSQGLSPGWGDLYDVDLPNQFIDVTDLPDGRYRLRVTTDQHDWFEEADERNNAAWIDFRLTGDEVAELVTGGGV
jgi:hypothetical protein